MSALTFTLKTAPVSKLDCSSLTPDRLQGLSVAQIGALKLGKEMLSPTVSDYFTVSGDDAQQIVFNQSTSLLDYLGSGMKHGKITIDGDAGDYLGAGMLNGTIVCKGNAGERLGDQMRRGLVMVEGNVGDYAASRMKAGTIGIAGKVGDYLGFGMKRGTILLLNTPKLMSTLQDCGAHNLPFLNLLFKSLAPLDTLFSGLNNNRVQRYAGDVGVNGRGEVLILKAE